MQPLFVLSTGKRDVESWYKLTGKKVGQCQEERCSICTKFYLCTNASRPNRFRNDQSPLFRIGRTGNPDVVRSSACILPIKMILHKNGTSGSIAIRNSYRSYRAYNGNGKDRACLQIDAVAMAVIMAKKSHDFHRPVGLFPYSGLSWIKRQDSSNT